MSCYMLHVTHYMCGVGIRLRCGATCKSKLVCLSAALFSLCPQHTLTAVVVDVNEVFILTLSYHRSSLLLVFFSIISGPFFAPHIPFFLFPLKISLFLSTTTKFQTFPSPFHVTYHNWDAPLSQGEIAFLGSSKVSIFSLLGLMGLFDSAFNSV